MLSLPAGLILLAWMFGRRGPTWAVSLRHIIVPILMILTLTATGLCIYNVRVTNNPLRMPYQVHEETYARAPVFVWQQPRAEPQYHHETIRSFHNNFALRAHENQQSIAGLIHDRLYLLYRLGLGTFNVFAIAVIGILPFVCSSQHPNGWARRALGIYVFFALGLTMETFMALHYIAPVVPLNYFFVLSALRLWARRNRRVGRFILWLLPVSAALLVALSLYRDNRHDPSSDWHVQRARLLDQMKQRQGKHLILVSYGPRHSFHEEWVYNPADIDAAKVVWARRMNSAQDYCRLLEYFKERQIWALEIDREPFLPKAVPYTAESCN
jgi:hypothetical protein